MGRKVRLAKLTASAWNDLIERWNELPRDERSAIRQGCLAAGHVWALAPIGMLCCVNCLDYIHPEDQ